MKNKQETAACRGDPGFMALATRPDVCRRAFRMAMIVGPVIGGINHGDKIVSGTMLMSDWLKVVLTFIVPFSVSTWSSVMAMRDRDRDV